MLPDLNVNLNVRVTIKKGEFVVLVLRTRRSMFASAPSRLLLWATIGVSALALATPFLTPVARLFGFVPLPGTLLVTSGVVVLAYLGATELIKRWFYRRPPGR